MDTATAWNLADTMKLVKEIDCFIVSCNRSFQLQACLQSLYDNTENLIGSVHVLYKTSNQDFENGYMKLRAECEKFKDKFHVLWNMEGDSFRDSFLDLLSYLNNKSANNLILCFTDDTLLFRKFNSNADCIQELFDENVLCCSLRLGKNTTIQDCATGLKMPPIPIEYSLVLKGEKWLYWNYKKCSIDTNLGYPISLDGCIYKIQDLLDMSSSIEFQNLRDWESNLVFKTKDSHKKEIMCCPEQSCCVNIPLNFTQYPYLHHTKVSPFGKSLNELNQIYLNNGYLDIEKTMNSVVVVGSHQLIEMIFSYKN